MADDVTLNAMSGGNVIGADLIAGVNYQRVKLIYGADGVNSGDVATANPLPVIDASVFAEDAAHTTADKGNFILGVRNDSATTTLTSTDGDYSPIAVDLKGQLFAKSSQFGTWTVDVNAVGVTATSLGKAEDAAHTTGDYGVMMLAVRASSPTDRSVGPTDGDYEPLGVNEVGALWVTETSSANGGDSTMNATSSDGGTALTNTAQVIKASAGKLTGYYIYNPNSTAQFVLFYNTAAASVTVGTTNPLFMLTIPPTSAANLSNLRVAFGTAMSWAAASTAGGNGAPGTALDATCWFK
jgi:hypothetical protein